jgi:hypothetical protein
MKTPREVLFQRHHSAEAKLDRIREHAVAGLKVAPSAEVENLPRTSLLRNFIFPLRWHLAGLGVAWLIVVFLNIDRASDASPTQQADGEPRHLLAELRENRRQIFELVETPVSEPLAAPPTFIPRRRSALESPSVVV